MQIDFLGSLHCYVFAIYNIALHIKNTDTSFLSKFSIKRNCLKNTFVFSDSFFMISAFIS